MAALDFPASPTLNQTYPAPAVPGVPVYTWDGEKWTTTGGAVGSTGAADDPPLMDGTASVGSSTQWAREDHVHPTDTSRAPLASPVFTGDPKAPTPSAGDNDTTIATTAFVHIYAAPFDALAYNGMQINGAMDVSQENGASGVGLSGTLTKYIVDGWLVGSSGTQVVTGQQVATAPVGYSAALQVWVGTANAAVAAGHYVYFTQRIEGYRIARLAWGTANAQPLTFGFWIFANRPGNYSGAVCNGPFNRSYPFSFTINAALTWEFKTITVPGDTTGTWPKDNTAGLQIIIAVMAGSSLTAPAGAWAAGGYLGATGTINGVAATSDYIMISGFILLPGTEAPSAARSPFIMRPYDQELQTCKRYFYSGWPPLRGFISATNLASRMGAPHPVTMRASPTVTGVAAPGSLQVFTPGGAINVTAINTNFSTVSVIELELAVAGGSSGQPAIIFQGNAGIFLVDARL